MTLALLMETGVRSILLASGAGLAIALLRVRSSAVKLAVWRLVLLGCLLMPLASLPWRVPARVAPTLTKAPAPVVRVIARAQAVVAPLSEPGIAWSDVLIRGYCLVSGLLLLRALLGLIRVRQLWRSGLAVQELGSDVVESASVRVPVTCGRRILLPADWREWNDGTLEAVLAHERSHVNERDFLTQALSKLNCALQWANPLSWWLDARLVALAEEVSDDAALRQAGERPSYATLLLGFSGRGERLAWGVAMARQAPVAGRIDRILDEARELTHPLSARGQVVLATTIFAAAFLIGVCRTTPVSAQTKPPGAPSGAVTGGISGGVKGGVSGGVVNFQGDFYSWNDSDGDGWALVQPGSSSFSGNGSMGRARRAGRGLQDDYIWFSHEGADYRIDDPATVSQVREWIRPQQELGRQQGELGERQGALGEQMGKLGDEMGRLGDQMSNVKVDMPKLAEEMKKLQALAAQLEKSQATLSDLGDLQSRIGELQSRLGEVQGSAGDKQSKIGDLQSKLGEQQSKLGEQQAELGEQQAKLGEQQSKMAEAVNQKVHRLFEQTIKDGRAKVVK